MVRKIYLLGKNSSNNAYICAGNACESCAVKFTCFTLAKNETLDVDWDGMRKIKGSPTIKLRHLTHSKIYVRGSKKYIELAKSVMNLRESYRTWKGTMQMFYLWFNMDKEGS